MNTIIDNLIMIEIGFLMVLNYYRISDGSTIPHANSVVVYSSEVDTALRILHYLHCTLYETLQVRGMSIFPRGKKLLILKPI